ncbi:hypothetical protein MUK42_35120 [Musa troglodytarum]|uniref:Uncharacterized protein n=1 Tax=Musa troglodytarum TaxID=320322 RepID=A0A9E7JYK2_9LILI|nr:hypothetical protein MUK42_35120 [Musa troglodytarum]
MAAFICDGTTWDQTSNKCALNSKMYAISGNNISMKKGTVPYGMHRHQIFLVSPAYKCTTDLPSPQAHK